MVKKKQKKKFAKFKRKLKTSKWSPIRAIQSEEKRTIFEAKTGRIKIKLSKQDALVIAIMAVTSAIIIAFTKIMIFMRWSTFPDNSFFSSWHPITPWLYIFAALLYVFVVWSKGIRYWLVYFPIIFSIVYCVVEICMIEAWLPPQALKSFFDWLGPLPEWLTGSPLS